MKRGLSPMCTKWLALVLCWPLLALAETEESASSVDDWSDNWEAAHCPGALPPEESPYTSRMEHYAETGEDEKRLEMEAKHSRYVDCTMAIRGGASIPILAYDSYQSSMKMGSPESAELFTLEATLDKVIDQDDPRYPVVRKLYEAGYTQEMVDMADANPDEARNVLVKEHFCDCLAIPVEEFY
ncbi:hypothetical protein LPL18_002135 [Halomonas sp. CUBES01]|uniref:hypothetical protein n=1 Tax=Halomonas sp. CUBES01 TaxID=2897340 RepID=UPI001E5D7874|nr:hypothetical protein [Halomonas sp. CUBES01]MEC4766135.1 hypothetical protein [Halomonas sp. CUBES01]